MVIKWIWLQCEQRGTEESLSSTPNIQVYNTTTADNCQKEINSELIYSEGARVSTRRYELNVITLVVLAFTTFF